MGNHIRKFNESDESSTENKLVVRVKHIIEYLQKNFDPEATVHLEHDGWYGTEEGSDNELDMIDNRGIFDKFDGSLFINN